MPSSFSAASSTDHGPIIYRKAVETATAIRQTFETVILCDLYPRSQIDIFITILQADGGEQGRAEYAQPDALQTPCRIAGKQSASINAATLALMDAGIAMSDFVVSCSAGYLDKTAICGELTAINAWGSG